MSLFIVTEWRRRLSLCSSVSQTKTLKEAEMYQGDERMYELF